LTVSTDWSFRTIQSNERS